MVEPFSLTWTAHEFEHRPKESLWFWVSIGVALLLFFYAIWERNLLFALFVVVAEILVIVWGNREPRDVDITVDSKGVRIGDHAFYPKSHIEAFSIVQHEHTDWHDLIILLDQRYIPTIKVHAPEHHIPELRQFLQTLYPEYDHQESFVEILERYFWF